MNAPLPHIPGERIDGEGLHVLRQELAGLLGRRNLAFPGAQPVSFAREHLIELQRREYFLCEKTDGIRCLLYCNADREGNEVLFLIDRHNDFYHQSDFLHFPVPNDPSFMKFHVGTVIDGELVNDRIDSPYGPQYQLRFLVFDCLTLDNMDLTTRPLDIRIGKFQEFFWKPYHNFMHKNPDLLRQQPWELKMKEMEFSYALTRMFKEKIPRLRHGNDGLVFTCKETPYCFGTDVNIIKWKPPHENTIDFRLQLGEFPVFDPKDGGPPIPDYDDIPVMYLLVHHGGGNHEHFDDLFVTWEEWESMKRINEIIDGRIIECHKDEQGRWRYKHNEDGSPRFRDDKADANHISTVHKVLKSISDGVTEEDLVQMESKIRETWKARQAKKELEKQEKKRLAEEGGTTDLGQQKRRKVSDGGM